MSRLLRLLPALVLVVVSYPSTRWVIRYAERRGEEARLRAEEARLRAEGREEAERDIAAGRLKSRTFGLILPWAFREREVLRERLGVETEGVGDCMVSNDMVERTRGYNERMGAEIAGRFGAEALDRIHREVVTEWHRGQEERDRAWRKVQAAGSGD